MSDIEAFRAALARSKRVAVLTGAGLSAASGKLFPVVMVRNRADFGRAAFKGYLHGEERSRYGGVTTSYSFQRRLHSLTVLLASGSTITI